MLITNPADYQIGDFVLVDGIPISFHAREDSKVFLMNLIPKVTGSPPFTFLSGLLGRWDKAWRVLKRKPWHVAFLTGKGSNDDWYVGEAKGGAGVCESRLKDFKEPYLVFRWFDTPPDEGVVLAFMSKHMGDKYDNFWGYLFTILWFFVSWFPRVIDRRVQCWEFLYAFATAFGKPIDEEYAYPLITILMVKVG